MVMESILRSKHFKKRRRRTIINSKDLEKLENLFKTSQWPDKVQKERLSKTIGKSENFISTWFQNRRARMRRLARQKDLLDDVDVNSVRHDDTEGTSDTPNETRSSQKRLHKYRPHVYPKPTKVHQSDDKTKTAKQESLKCQEAEDPMPEDYHSLTKVGSDKKCSDNDLDQMYKKQRNETNKGVKMTKGPNDVIPSERRVFIETPSPNDQSTAWENVFRRIIDMMAASESIMSKSDTTFPYAIKDAALGVRLKDGKLYYNRDYGLDFEDED